MSGVAGYAASMTSTLGGDGEVVGVGGVAVAPDLRGRGPARLVVTAALDHAHSAMFAGRIGGIRRGLARIPV
ncbi:GNAT family N-acetyltransferase [Streptomyces sp.]|uniref:GNAT family N-acetyltransferase n=1 Tax=Streptomyces sp. TaxID=1931 RepID=UPI002F94A10F